MLLYRIIQRDIASTLRFQPQNGHSFLNSMPFLYAFNSFAAALIEHPLFADMPRIADNFRVAQYSLPDGSLHVIGDDEKIYRRQETGLRELGHWAESFLRNGAALVAEFPSRNWKGQFNHIINPEHPLFSQAEVQEIINLR